MSTPQAMRKLREARFFLTCLRAEPGKNSGAFSYYLSAFLGAADSVIDVGRKEAKVKKGEYESWLATLDESERRWVEFMTDQRNAEIHRDGASTAVESREVPVVFYPHVQPLPIELAIRGSWEEGPSGPEGLPHWVRVWIPMPEPVFSATSASRAPVLDVCDRYCAVLAKFLKWLEARG